MASLGSTRAVGKKALHAATEHVRKALASKGQRPAAFWKNPEKSHKQSFGRMEAALNFELEPT